MAQRVLVSSCLAAIPSCSSSLRAAAYRGASTRAAAHASRGISSVVHRPDARSGCCCGTGVSCSFHASAAPPGKNDDEDNASQPPRAGSVGDAIPISVFNDAEDPVIGEDDAYPDWLWKLADAHVDSPSFDVLASTNVEELDLRQMKRLGKLERKNKIRRDNIVANEL